MPFRLMLAVCLGLTLIAGCDNSAEREAAARAQAEAARAKEIQEARAKRKAAIQHDLKLFSDLNSSND